MVDPRADALGTGSVVVVVDDFGAVHATDGVGRDVALAEGAGRRGAVVFAAFLGSEIFGAALRFEVEQQKPTGRARAVERVVEAMAFGALHDGWNCNPAAITGKLDRSEVNARNASRC